MGCCQVKTSKIEKIDTMDHADTDSQFVPIPGKQTLELIAKDADDCFELALLDKTQISPDTFKFSFKLPEED